jgi:hypothetical protein
MRGAQAPRIVASVDAGPPGTPAGPRSAVTPWLRSNAMPRPSRFESFRYLGDKRTQVVYDTDRDDPAISAAVDELVLSEQFTVFGPDTLGEARNRGYHLDRRAAAADRDASAG